MSEVFNSSVLDAINRAVQDGISTTALEVDGTPQYCIINAETREIEIPGELNIFGVESDEKSTRVYFRCPKYVGTNVDLDMTQCMVYVPYRNANGEKDQYIVTDLNETEDGENVEFTWLISRKASAYMGITEFGIRAIKTATGGTIEAEWNTTVASANVIRGMDVGLLEFSEENKDALAQALDLINQELEQTKNEMNSAIETKGQQTLATIPDDYTTAAQNALSAKNEVEDIRVGFDGTTYDSAGDAVRGQVGLLFDDVDKIFTDNYYPRVNLLPPDNLIYGKAFNQKIGSSIDDLFVKEDYVTYPIITDVEIGEQYSVYIGEKIDKYGGIVGYYNREGKLLSFSGNSNIIIPEDCTKVRISYLFARGTLTQFKKGTDSITSIDLYKRESYIPDIKERLEKLENSAEDNKEFHDMTYIYVALNGSDDNGDGTKEKPFSTVYYANEMITDASKNKPYTILVGPGTYTDLQEKYSGNVDNSHFQGIVTKDYVFYESETGNPNDTIISWDGATGISSPTRDNVVSKCPFHIVVGENGKTHIKGFKFFVKNARYGIHCESSGFAYNGEWIIENCIIDWQGSEDCIDDDGKVPAVGIGMSPNEYAFIKNCKIITRTNTSILIHDGIGRYDNKAFISGAKLTIQGCDLGSGRFQFQSIYPKTGELNAKTNNVCIVKNSLPISELYSYISKVNKDEEMLWRLYTCDCDIENIGNMSNYVFQIGEIYQKK